MIEAFLDGLLDWVSRNPDLTGLIIFLVAAGESLLLVGMVVPGAAAMAAFGAVGGDGRLTLAAAWAWAAAGAVVGDAVSFWIGRRFRNHLYEWGPFRRHPEWLERGELFVRRHGAKSVALGRFVGPLRAVVPAVAGMLGMPPRRFLVINVLSALVWAPAYLLPGLIAMGPIGQRLWALPPEVWVGLGLLALIALGAWYHWRRRRRC